MVPRQRIIRAIARPPLGVRWRASGEQALPPGFGGADPEGEELGIDDGALGVELAAEAPDPELDEEAANLDIGVTIELPDEGAQLDDAAVTMELTALLATTTEDLGDDDGSGPIGLDLAQGLVAGPDFASALDDEPTEPMSDLCTEPLPELDADDEGFAERTDPALPGSAWDEPPPPCSENPWRWDPAPRPQRPCAALAVGTEVVAAGGRGVCWLVDPRARTPNLIPDQLITSLALVGPAPTVALAVTHRGAVLRLARDGAVTPAEPWQAAASVPPGAATSLEVHTLTSGVTSSVIGKTTTGVLLRSEDAGRRWTAIDLGGPVVALSTGVDSPVALVRAASGLVVARGSHDGATWVRRALDKEAATIAAGRAPMVAAVDSCVLVADAELGVAMSTDGGATYRRLTGCAGATALTVGRMSARPAAWLTLHSETTDATDLVLIDLDREVPSRVARVESTDEDARAEVVALAWDDTAGRLWAVGGFGVGTFSPPRQ